MPVMFLVWILYAIVCDIQNLAAHKNVGARNRKSVFKFSTVLCVVNLFNKNGWIDERHVVMWFTCWMSFCEKDIQSYSACMTNYMNEMKGEWTVRYIMILILKEEVNNIS